MVTLRVLDLGENVSTQYEDGESLTATTLLLEIKNDVRSLNTNFDTMDETVNVFRAEIRELNSQNEKLTADLTALSEKLKSMETNVTNNYSRKQESIERQVRRSNLKLFNIPKPGNEYSEDLEEIVLDKISKELGINKEDIGLDTTHHGPSRTSPNPILTRV